MDTLATSTTAMLTSTTAMLSEAEALLLDYNNEMRRATMPVIVFVATLCVLGLLGNLLVLYVFLFKYKSCNFRYFVLCLCLTDLTSSLTTIPGEVVTQLFWYIYPYRMLCKVKSFFNVFTVCAEALCLLAISVDRHRKVCRPHGWQIRPRIALALCGLVNVVAFVLALPVSIFWGTHTEIHQHKGQNITVTKCEKDQAYVDSHQPLAYSASVQGIVSVCLLVMFILYILVARTLLKNKGTKSKALTPTAKPPVSGSTIPSAYTLSPKLVVNGGTKPMPRPEESGYSTYIDSDFGPEAASRDTDTGMRTDDETYTNSDFDVLSDTDLEKKKQGRCNKSNKARASKKHKTNMASRIQRKTRITFILSTVFIITTIVYFTLLDLIATNILTRLSSSEKAAYFFFFRIVFINHVINPVVYGVLDPQFRKEMKQLPRRIIKSCCCCFKNE